MRHRADRHGAIWGAGPVGQMTIRSAVLLGAKQAVSIECLPERLSMARAGGAVPINFEGESVVERLNDLTHGKGRRNASTQLGSRHTPRPRSTRSTTGPSRC